MAGIGTVNFGGLATGLDTNKIIDDLMSVESKPVRRLEAQKADLTKKQDTFTSMKSSLLDLKNSVTVLKSSVSFGAFSASSSDEEALTLSASSSANAGTYKIKILSLAQAETLSSRSFADTDTRLGLKGEILVNGKSLRIKNTDTIMDIRSGINSLDTGVNASILQVTEGDYRLIISSDTQGENGLFIANVGDSDMLGELGLTDSTKNIREISGGKVLSSTFDSATATIGSLIGISSNVTGKAALRGETLNINLGNDTLSTIRDKINALGITGVSAAVESVSEDDTTSYRLAITGTENFEDDNNVLETLGILERGKSGTQAEFATDTLFISNGGEKNGGGNSGPAELTTNLSDLGALVDDTDLETITISGVDENGSTVEETLEIAAETTVEDVLSAIEDAFSGAVTASLDNGKIVVQSVSDGETSLQFNIRANNENGGTLDFGVASQTVEGRARQVVEGNNARMLVNNIEITRTSNEISDVLTGLNLTLKKADEDNEISITIERNDDEIQKKIEDFVDKYNEFIDLVDENSKYDEEKKEAGPLLGDQTTRTIQYRIRNAIQSSVYDGEFEYNQLAQIGIESTSEGKLKIDTSKLKDAMDKDMESVVSLFTATRTSSDNDISFVYHSDKSKAGTYDVAITRAAEKAEALSDVLNVLPEKGTLRITDNYDSTVEVEYTKGMSIEDLANTIMDEAETSYEGIFKSANMLWITGSSEPITHNTSFDGIEGVTVEDGDTISITVSNRHGREYQRILTLEKDDDTSVADILDVIEDLTNNEVRATVDTDGRIMVQDLNTGKNEYNFSIETTVQGLDFGEFVEEQIGRNTATIEAAVSDDNRLIITHTSYGADSTFTIEGGLAFGLNDGVYAGIDVAGTINGVEGTGRGSSLTASNDDENSRGIVISSEITPEELDDEGTAQGTVTLISGIADLVYSELQAITSPISGFIQVKIDSFERMVNSTDTRIDNANKRLDQRRTMYVRKFTALERAMARLNSLQQRLTSMLSALPTTSFL